MMLPSWLSLMDVVFVVVILLFTWGGFRKGFAAQLAHVLVAVLSSLLLFFAYPPLYAYFGRVFRGLEEAYLMWLLLVVLAAVSIGLFMLMSKIMARVIKTQMSDGLDAGWGLLFGFFRGILTTLITLILIVMLDRSGRMYDLMRIKSQVGQIVCYQLVPKLQPKLASLYENKIRDWKSGLLERKEAGEDLEF